MIWEEDKQDQDLLEFVSKLIKLRKENQAFGNKGTFQILSANNETNHVMYTKTYQGQTIVFVYNNSNTRIRVDIPFNLKGKRVLNLLTGDYFIPEKVELDVVILPFDLVILSFN
nr:alpha-glucosidase C-terminal domain-containing protein [Neobacillus ginsengisoli]